MRPGIAPNDPDVLLHLGRALIALDRDQEAETYLAQFAKLRPERTRDPRREPGMIELATLSPDERRRREIERFRRDAAAHPGDPELQLHLAGLLLADGRMEQAVVAYRELLAQNADWRVWREAGLALMDARQYQLGREFLERAATGNPAAGLDLSIAVFFTEGPVPALQSLEKVPEQERSGDYILMKARILDAAGRNEEAGKLLQEGLRQSASRADVAEEAARLLLRMNRAAEALQMLDRVAQVNPDNPNLSLERAILQAIAGQKQSAEATIKSVELRWPEWDRAYLAHGLLLESNGQTADARHKFRTAAALGLSDTGRCALLRLDGKPPAIPECACISELRDLMLPKCQPPK